MSFFLAVRRAAFLFVPLIALTFSAACGDDDAPGDSTGTPQDAALMGARVTPNIAKAGFTLTGTEGQPYEFLQETEGRLTLLYFGYTNCPDICPTHVALLAGALRDLPAEVRAKVTVVFVTTDPDRDTPERLRQWLDALGGPQFVGLTGTQAEVDAVQRLYGLEPAGKEDLGNGHYAVNHAAYVMAFEADGVSRIVYPAGTTKDMLLNDLPILAGVPAGAPAASGSAGDVHEHVVASAGPLEIHGVSARASVGENSAVYLTVSNSGAAADRLVAASSPSAGDVQVHESVAEGSSMAMREVDGIDVPAHGEAALEPGGYHIMLLGLFAPLVEGQSITVELTFEKAGTVTFAAPVLDYGSEGGAHGMDGAPEEHSGDE